MITQLRCTICKLPIGHVLHYDLIRAVRDEKKVRSEQGGSDEAIHEHLKKLRERKFAYFLPKETPTKEASAALFYGLKSM